MPKREYAIISRLYASVNKVGNSRSRMEEILISQGYRFIVFPTNEAFLEEQHTGLSDGGTLAIKRKQETSFRRRGTYMLV